MRRAALLLAACAKGPTPLVVASEAYECAILLRGPDGAVAPGAGRAADVDAACDAAIAQACVALKPDGDCPAEAYELTASSTSEVRSFTPASRDVRRDWRRAARNPPADPPVTSGDGSGTLSR